MYAAKGAILHTPGADFIKFYGKDSSNRNLAFERLSIGKPCRASRPRLAPRGAEEGTEEGTDEAREEGTAEATEEATAEATEEAAAEATEEATEGLADPWGMLLPLGVAAPAPVLLVAVIVQAVAAPAPSKVHVTPRFSLGQPRLGKDWR